MTDHQLINPLTSPLSRASLSRRNALKGFAGLGAAGFLTACGSPGTGGSGSTGPATTGDTATATTTGGADSGGDGAKVVNWSSWPEYLDVDSNGTWPSITAFEDATGIKVTYNEDYTDNDVFFQKVRPQLSSGQDTGRDVWISTDWMVARLVRLGYVQKLDYANIPNATANMDPSYQHVAFDDGRIYSLPWQAGFSSLAWNDTATGGKAVTSMDQLLTDPALKGKVTLLTEFRDTVGLILIELGYRMDTVTLAQFQEAVGEIKKAVDSGQIKGFTGNEYTTALVSGETAACVAWTGDIVQLLPDNPSLKYKLGDTGIPRWTDNWVIPNKAAHKANAEKLINHYFDPKIMAMVADYVNYIPPVVGVKDILMAQDPDVANNQLIFPDEATLAKAQTFRALTADEETQFNDTFQAVVTG
jgi:spermidine/putrescine transport system substrate-binding protein